MDMLPTDVFNEVESAVASGATQQEAEDNVRRVLARHMGQPYERLLRKKADALIAIRDRVNTPTEDSMS